MPAIAVAAIRYIIIAAVQLGIFAAIERWILPMLNTAVSEVMQLFGVSEDTATDIMANEYLQTAEAVGLTAAIIMSRTPLKVADKLKFNTKGWGKRPISAATATKVTTAKTAAVQTTSSTVSALDKASKWATIAIGAMGIPVGMGLLITNTIDFGAWPSSAYQGSIQKFLSFFGIDPDAESRQPRTTSADTFNKIYTALKNAGVVSLNDPYKGQTVLFDRNTCLDLVDRVASDLLILGGDAPTKKILAIILPLTNMTAAKIDALTKTTTPTVSVPASSSSVKVFTGVMSQGTLGTPATFTERQDDLITSMTDLQDAAINNLAPWLATLLGKVIYEIKLVSSVMTKDGVTLHGSTQRFVSSYTTTGTPRYKSVTNKFAIMNMFIMTDRGTRMKIAQITLGPTDAVKLQPTITQIATITQTIGSAVVTDDVTEIHTIATSSPITVTTPVVTQPTPVTPQVTQPTPVTPQVTQPTPVTPQVTQPTPTPTVIAVTPTTSNVCATGTLYDFYAAKGQSLPPISSRGMTYEYYRLGLAAYYSGTAEQNTKLLAALKTASGCR